MSSFEAFDLKSSYAHFLSESMSANFFESKTAPFTNGGSILMSPVELNVLNWMSEAKLENTIAYGYIASHLYNRHTVN